MDDLTRKQTYRRALAGEAGREMLADILGRVGVHRVNTPLDGDGRVDALALARQEGARGLALEIMALGSVEFRLDFPPLASEAPRPKTIDTE